MRRTAGRNVNGVLIESDWNLKLFSLYEIGWPVISVLIESDWNLKQAAQAIPVTAVAVLIESDWNLKCVDDSVNRVDSFWY